MFALLRAILRFFGFIIIQLPPPDVEAERTLPVATIPFAIGARGEQPPGLDPPPLPNE